MALTAQTLRSWLQAQLTEGEAVGQVFLEPDGTHSEYDTSVDAEGNESQVVTSSRPKLSAAVTAQTLLSWLQSQLTEGEAVGQVFLEPDGTHSDYETSVDAEGNESQSVTSTRAKLSAAVTAHAAAGSRSVVFSSESLPTELRDGLLAAWAVIEGMP